MKTKTSRACLAPEGSLTIFEAAAFQRQLIEFLRQPPPRRLDLSRVSSLDTSCLQLLLAARREQAVGEFEIVGLREDVRRHIERIGASIVLTSTAAGRSATAP